MKSTKAKHYAAIKIWKDRPDNMQVIDYFYTEKETRDFIKKQKKDESMFEWDVAKYE
jgi:hypothetical protein